MENDLIKYCIIHYKSLLLYLRKIRTIDPTYRVDYKTHVYTFIHSLRQQQQKKTHFIAK